MNSAAFDKNKLDLFIDSLHLKTWFRNLGKNSIGQTNSLKYINSLKNAILIWNNTMEDRIEQFNNIRPNNDLWDKTSEIVFNSSLIELKKNPFFMAFSKSLDRVPPENIIRVLPILGYYAETVSSVSNGYFKQEIDIYKKGHFVCEHTKYQLLIF